MNQELEDVIGEFDAGIFSDKFIAALKLVALGVVEHGKKGNVTINLNLSQIGDGVSVKIEHTLKYAAPTKNGKKAEENTTHTPMYVDGKGNLTISPKAQQDLFTGEKANVTTLRK